MPHLTLVLKSPSKALPAVHQAVPTAPALPFPLENHQAHTLPALHLLLLLQSRSGSNTAYILWIKSWNGGTEDKAAELEIAW